MRLWKCILNQPTQRAGPANSETVIMGHLRLQYLTLADFLEKGSLEK